MVLSTEGEMGWTEGDGAREGAGGGRQDGGKSALLSRPWEIEGKWPGTRLAEDAPAGPARWPWRQTSAPRRLMPNIHQHPALPLFLHPPSSLPPPSLHHQTCPAPAPLLQAGARTAVRSGRWFDLGGLGACADAG